MFYERYVCLNIKGDFLSIVPNNPPHVIDIHYYRTINTTLLTANGLASWDIVIQNLETNILGTCNNNEQTIYINPTSFYLLDFQQMRELIIHEVAHALTPDNGHNDIWQAKDLELGGTGRAQWNIVDLKCVDNKYLHYQIKLH